MEQGHGASVVNKPSWCFNSILCTDIQRLGIRSGVEMSTVRVNQVKSHPCLRRLRHRRTNVNFLNTKNYVLD